MIAALGCAPGVAATQTLHAAPEDTGDDIVSFRDDPGCCEHVEHRFDAGDETPYGASVRARLADHGHLRCTMRQADGSETHWELRVTEPANVVFREGRAHTEGCSLCFSTLSFEARVQVHSQDGAIFMQQTTTLRQLEPADGYGFELVKGDRLISGVFHPQDSSMRLFAFNGEETEGEPLADSTQCKHLSP